MYTAGPSIGYVYKGDSNGFTQEGLVEARRMLNEDIPQAEEMDEVLGRVIDGPVGTDIVKELRAEGKSLMGASRTLRQDTPEGLMYTDGFPVDEDHFSVVRMGLWIARVGSGGLSNSIVMREEHRDAIRESFLNGGLNNVDSPNHDGMDWGVLVARTTKVVPIHPQEGDIHEEFIYGHRKDLLAVAGLEVPQDLKAEITAFVQRYHSEEDPTPVNKPLSSLRTPKPCE